MLESAWVREKRRKEGRDRIERGEELQLRGK